jgi:hypothetical protein
VKSWESGRMVLGLRHAPRDMLLVETHILYVTAHKMKQDATKQRNC